MHSHTYGGPMCHAVMETPVKLAAVYAWVLLGETVGPVQMPGGLVVLAGIYLARRAS